MHVSYNNRIAKETLGQRNLNKLNNLKRQLLDRTDMLNDYL